MQIKGIDQNMIRQLELESSANESTSSGPSFAEALQDAIQTADRDIQQADAVAEAYVAGEGDLHNAMIAMEQADVSFQTLLQVRNKLLDAYNEIMRMQV